MIKLLLSCVLAIASFAPAQTLAPVIDAAPYLGGVLTTHSDGTVTLARVSKEGELELVSLATAGGQVLTTSWTDASGVSHQVQTQVPSSTSAGMKRAIEDHKELVEAMQAAFPPRNPGG